MIHELVQYAQSLPESIRGEAGFTSKAIRWLINFNPKGEYLGVVDLSQEDRPSKGREFKQVPHLRFSGDTPMRQFLVDTAQYALLFGQDIEDQKVQIKHKFFLDLLLSASKVEPFLGIVADKLKKESILQEICQDLDRQSPSPKASDNVTFSETSHEGTRIIVETNVWHAWWRDFFPTLFKMKTDKVQPMRCFLSGKLESPARTHPKIKGLSGDLGGNIETTLIGFNLDAFCSYGLQQSANAAIASPMAERYAAALNYLIANNSQKLAGVKVVYWYVGDVRKEEDPLSLLFDITSFGDVEVVAFEPLVDLSVNEARYVSQAESRAAKMLAAIRYGDPEALRARAKITCTS
ncbi:type I-C CRISPR-associated protein Cas8c/Csd1 [candidate division KSB1 bacterium]|nr:type I-C CRISPR-associated protein Cas8c/Csd1 [candidate division KSB1 bacterium]